MWDNYFELFIERKVCSQTLYENFQNLFKAETRFFFLNVIFFLLFAVDSYGYMVNGVAAEQIEKFKSEQHDFEEYQEASVVILIFFFYASHFCSSPVIFCHFQMIFKIILIRPCVKFANLNVIFRLQDGSCLLICMWNSCSHSFEASDINKKKNEALILYLVKLKLSANKKGSMN